MSGRRLRHVIGIVAAARLRRVPRCPLMADGLVVGSVALAHLPALRAFADVVQVAADHVVVLPRPDRDAALDSLHRSLAKQGLIRGWRDEIFAMMDPATLVVLARIERAAARFWGCLTFGAHATGFVRGAGGEVERLWIARRSVTKATDPGRLDNLVGGGVPHDQNPRQALLREAWEEAGLPAALAGRALQHAVLELDRDIAEGLQFERLFAFDIELPADFRPQNHDGEVAEFPALTPAAVWQELLAGALTVDAALVTLDFLLRQGLVDAAAEPDLQAAMATVRCG